MEGPGERAEPSGDAQALSGEKVPGPEDQMGSGGSRRQPWAADVTEEEPLGTPTRPMGLAATQGPQHSITMPERGRVVAAGTEELEGGGL